jgi:ABC-2 type transport system ATP-binding protein
MVVKIDNLVKRYGDLIALDHFNLEVAEGEIFGLLGPNGSGKTTAIMCMLALLKFSKGEVSVFGKPMRPDAYDIKRDIGIIMQNVAVYDELTVFENIDYFCGLYILDKKKRRELVEEAISFVGLNEFRRFYPRKLSGGLLRRLNIACGIAHKPKLIILDEPTVAVDPQSRNKILEGIVDLNRQGATVIYTSHYMEEVEQICTRLAIMDKGKVIASGSTSELKSMIRTGEKITIEIIDEQDTQVVKTVEQIQALPTILSASLNHKTISARSEQNRHSLSAVTHLLNENKIAYGRVYCELPTLNDVFLEMTGKHLRDQQGV